MGKTLLYTVNITKGEYGAAQNFVLFSGFKNKHLNFQNLLHNSKEVDHNHN